MADEEEKVVHLTRDMLRVDEPGHEAHFVVRFYTDAARPGKAAKLEVICSCGMLFRLSGKPRKPK